MRFSESLLTFFKKSFRQFRGAVFGNLRTLGQGSTCTIQELDKGLVLQNIFVCICLKQPRFCRSWVCKRIQQISLVLLVITTSEKYYFIVLFQCMPLQGQGVFSVKFSLIFQAHSFLWLQGWRFCTYVSYVAIRILKEQLFC